MAAAQVNATQRGGDRPNRFPSAMLAHIAIVWAMGR